MVNKKIKGLLFILLILFCIAAVNAENNNTVSDTTDNINVESNTNIIATADDSDDISVGTFSDLNKTINDTNIELKKNYTYNNATDFDFKNGIDITKDTTINGNGFTINGNNSAKIFNVASGVTLTLKNIKLINANSTTGGAIYSTGNLTLINVTFTQNNGHIGGAIYSIRGTVTIINSTFDKNTAESSGGVINSGGNITVINSTFTNNNAAATGGAIFGNKNITITNSNFTNNTATANGGAVYCNGNINVANSNFKNNTARNGGAIQATNSVTIANSNFDKNKAEQSGGAISNYNNGVTVNNSTFTNNNATNGGAIYSNNGNSNINSSKFIGNNATNGGAVYYENTNIQINPDVTLTVENSTFSENNAALGDDIYTKYYTAVLNNKWSENSYANIYAQNTVVGTSVVTILAGVNDRTLYVTSSDSRFKLNATVFADGASVGGYDLIITDEYNNMYNTVYLGNGTYEMSESALANFTERSYTAVMNDTYVYNYYVENGTVINNKENITIDIFVDEDVFSGETVTGNIELKDNQGKIANITGQVTVKIGNKEYVVNVTNGTGKFAIDNEFSNNNHTITAIFNGTTQYNPTNGVANFTVNKPDLKLNINVSNITYGEDLTADITVTDENGQIANITGQVTVEISGNIYTVNVTNGVGKLVVSDKLNAGNYTMTVLLNATTKYNSANATANFTVNKADSSIVVNAPDISYGENETVTIIMNSDINGEVTVYINGEEITVEIKNGTGKLILDNLKIGEYAFEVEFNGNDNYNPSNATGEFSVKRADVVLEVEDLTKYYGEDDKLNITLKDLDGNLLANDTVKITINGVTYTRNTDSNGQIFMSINLNPGVYETTVSYGSIVKNVTVTIKTTIESNNVVKYFKNGTQYYATFYNVDGTPLANTNVTFNIHGVFYTRETNNNGVAKLSINLNPGEYIITAINPVNKQMYANNITVLSTIAGSDIVKYFRNGTQYYATFYDANGNPLANTEVTFNINGVFYTRTTNNDGVAELSINLNPKEYIITAINPINGETYANKITVLSIIESEDLQMTTNNRQAFKATILDEQGSPLANTNVTFNINGVFYTRTSDANGVVSLNINLLAGKYIITTYFNGLSKANTITIVEA